MNNCSFIICWSSDTESNWEILNDLETKLRITELLSAGVKTIYVFPEIADLYACNDHTILN